MEIELDKSFRERIFHAVIFEVTANIIIALSLAWLMNVSVLQSGSLSVISALTATAWNFVFNKFFDALQKITSLKERSSSARSMRPVSKPDLSSR
ncbi:MULTISPECIES: chlorhexidine efflux transporter [unclassified Enterobacter]|uniref:chlorhexidine efflux transporter n=1 Tax=unclassified Enterobacter TaxID=2608935 RepID=UPI002168A585|nr:MULTISPECIES: chlorhexidine efflux transporter [unclassified Enterobacter]